MHHGARQLIGFQYHLRFQPQTAIKNNTIYYD